MLAIEDLTNRMGTTSRATWAMVAVITFMVYALYAYIALKRRIRRLGSRATTVLPYSLPYGVFKQIGFRALMKRQLT
jgi:uncharacterized membrane protein SirB2